MPKSSVRYNDGKWTIPVEAIILRIKRALGQLIPPRDLIYKRAVTGHFTRIMDINNPQHYQEQGPYYYSDLPGLARLLNIFPEADGYKPGSIVMVDRSTCKEYPENTLPPMLRFDVVTPVLLDAIRTIEAAGYTINPHSTSGKKWPLTAPVTNLHMDPVDTPNPDDDPETGEEMTEEEERILSGKS